MFETTNFGIILTLISLLLSILFLIIGILTRIFIFPKLRTKYHFLFMNIPKIFLGIFALIWFICWRYAPNVIDLINNGPGENGIMYSKILLLDLCPFIFVMINIFMIFDYKSKYINIIAVWAVIGASITIFGDGWGTIYESSKLEYIFIGDEPNKLYYFLHAWMLFTGFYFLGSTNRMNFYKTISAHIFVALYLIYVIIIVKTLNVKQNATGLVEFDWNNIYGEYHAITLMFNMRAPNVMYLSFFLIWLLLIIIITIKNECHHPKPFAFWPQIIYKKIHWLRKISMNYYQFKIKLFRFNNKRESIGSSMGENT